MSSVITDTTIEPLSLQEAKRQIQVEHDEDDLLISRLIAAARSYIESVTGCSIARKQRRLFLDDFSEAYLPFGPVDSISQVQYIDESGGTQTLSSSVYELNKSDDQILLSFNQNWPSARSQKNAVWVDYWCGYFSTSSSPFSYSVPEDMKALMLFVVSDLYLTREANPDMGLYKNPAFDKMLDSYRVYAL